MAQASQIQINHSDVPIRLFKSDFLEFFTHISPIAVLVIWAPVTALFLVKAVRDIPKGLRVLGGAWVYVPVAFLLGMLIWTFSEYTLHRFLFHYHAMYVIQLAGFFFLCAAFFTLFVHDQQDE